MADDEDPQPRDYIDGWTDELMEELEAYLTKRAEFDGLYPEPESLSS